jgi:hypothetical protein
MKILSLGETPNNFVQTLKTTWRTRERGKGRDINDTHLWVGSTLFTGHEGP